MVFEHIEKLQRQYTDKYVAVEDSRPELKRFKGQTGVVRTVNMSGRALVEFDANNNTGWIDIDIDYLKVVDKPAPKEVKKKPAAKKKAAPAAKKEDSALEKARGGKKKTGGMSVEEMMAAARGEKGSDAKATPAKKGDGIADILAAARSNKPAGGDDPKSVLSSKLEAARTNPAADISAKLEAARTNPAAGISAKMEAARTPMNAGVAETLAAARTGKPAAAPAAGNAKSLSVADMLAAARGEKAKDATPAEDPAVDEPTSASEPDVEPTSKADLPTDTAGIVAWCRANDAS